MRVLNIMLSRALGGVQQAFLDYNTALTLKKIELVTVSSIGARINHYLPKKSFKLPSIHPWDVISIIWLKYIISITKPSIIIAHGNRAINFAKIAKHSEITLIGVAHNYGIKGLRKCDYVIALTEHMRNYLLQNNFTRSQILMLPNMINIQRDFISNKTYRTPIVIGAIARFVAKKGIDIFLQALSLMQKKGYEFSAIIGGDGEEKAALLSLTKRLNLQDKVSFIGWIQDKHKFFDDIDIFCIPSLHEPFGIILLEAMASSVPIVSTDTEGPHEILANEKEGLLCRAGSSQDLAQQLIYLIEHPEQAAQYSKDAYLKVQKNYDIKIIATKLVHLLGSVDKKSSGD